MHLRCNSSLVGCESNFEIQAAWHQLSRICCMHGIQSFLQTTHGDLRAAACHCCLHRWPIDRNFALSNLVRSRLIAMVHTTTLANVSRRTPGTLVAILSPSFAVGADLISYTCLRPQRNDDHEHHQRESETRPHDSPEGLHGRTHGGTKKT